MRLIDQIWNECGEKNLTGIDDIDKIQITGYGLKHLMLDYEEEFEESLSQISELEDHIGMKIEVVQYIHDAQGKEYKIFSSVF